MCMKHVCKYVNAILWNILQGKIKYEFLCVNAHTCQHVYTITMKLNTDFGLSL